jgi:signal transduction histidine kinase
VAAYFVCAEALTNVAKHAAARVAVAVTSSEGRVRVEIADDGEAGPIPRTDRAYGARRPVETLGGTLRVESAPGRGTRLIVEIPLGGEAT